TVFVMSPDDGADARVRIFTPGTELPFAGHPVLGTAFVLGTQRRAEMIRLQTAAGVIPVWLRWNDDRVVFGEMEQPVPTPETFGQVDDLLAALGVQRSELPVEVYRNGPRHVFVTLDSEQAVSAIVPDMPALAAL